jgi:hypothetical protein
MAPAERKAASVIIIFICLFCLVGLKLLAMINAVRWILLHGTEYRNKISRTPALTREEHDRILDDCNAGFFPFGVKDYRLSRYLRNSDCRGTRRFSVGFFRKYLFQFPGPAFAGSALLIITAKAPHAVTLAKGDIYSWAGAAYGVLLLVVIITFSVEAFFSYAILGSYGIAFHRLHVPRESWWPTKRTRSTANSKASEPIITEMTAYGGIIITGYTTMASTVYFMSVRLGGFSSVPASHGGAFVQPDSLLDSLYWTVVVPADFNGAGPISAFPRFIALLGFICAFMMITFVVFALGITIATVQKPPDVSSNAIDKAAELTGAPPPGFARHATTASLKKRERPTDRLIDGQVQAVTIQDGNRPQSHGRPATLTGLPADEWSVADLAVELGMPTTTIYAWIHRGWITARRAPGTKSWIITANDQQMRELRERRAGPPAYHTRAHWATQQPQPDNRQGTQP